MEAYNARGSLSSLTRCIRIMLHVSGLACFTASFVWLPSITNPLHNGFGGSFQFLTIIGLAMSTITFGVGILTDITPKAELLALRGLLSLCATTLELLIGVLYWGCRAIDKRLVVPPGHEVPFIPDFGFHAVPAIVLVLDFMTLGPPWFINASQALGLGLVIAFSYWAWIEYCFSHNGWYPYPFLTILSLWKKLLICISFAVLIMGGALALQWTHAQMHKSGYHRKTTSDPAKIE
uniref:Uncharacterized protein n=1 Tax=Bionectria ochroleuca TaxID=29856 RepID=A0A0B7K8E1_BIOOC